MAKDEVRLRLDGVREHRGHVMAHALNQKLDRFLKTFSAFERAFLGSKVRQTDFEVTTLSHNSPSELGLNPVPRAGNYNPDPAVEWTLGQWAKITRGDPPDARIDDELVDDVVDLGSRPDAFAFSEFAISYAHHHINFNDTAKANALALRASLISARGTLPWRGGVSVGSLTGELRSVIDAQHQRQIVICPPLGEFAVTCIFPEGMRERIRDYLFRFVRVSGRLHYDDKSPIPHLIEIEHIISIDEPQRRLHMLDQYGLFRDSYYPKIADEVG